MSATFQSLLAVGLGQPFPLSVVYVAFIYVIAIIAILWAGLCIYLAIIGSLSLRRLLRGTVSDLGGGCAFAQQRNFP